MAERLALPTSDHGVAGSNPAGGEILPEPKRRFIAQSLSCSPFHRLEMTEILLKGRKTLTHPTIHVRCSVKRSGSQPRAPLHRFSSPFTGAHVFYRCAHICRSHLSRSHVHSIHKSALRKQDRTLFTGLHVHTSVSCVCLIHRRANILKVKYHVN